MTIASSRGLLSPEEIEEREKARRQLVQKGIDQTKKLGQILYQKSQLRIKQLHLTTQERDTP